MPTSFLALDMTSNPFPSALCPPASMTAPSPETLPAAEFLGRIAGANGHGSFSTEALFNGCQVGRSRLRSAGSTGGSIRPGLLSPRGGTLGVGSVHPGPLPMRCRPIVLASLLALPALACRQAAARRLRTRAADDRRRAQATQRQSAGESVAARGRRAAGPAAPRDRQQQRRDRRRRDHVSGADSSVASTGDAGRDAGADASADAGASLGASVLMMHNHINRDGTFIDSALTEEPAPRSASTRPSPAPCRATSMRLRSTSSPV